MKAEKYEMHTLSSQEMTVEQQDALFRDAEYGVKLISGKISFSDFCKLLGTPKRQFDSPTSIEYSWYPYGVMAISVTLDKSINKDGAPKLSSFEISVENDFYTNIPYQRFDNFGMSRIRRGEKIDNIRTEKSDFYNPSGVIDPLGSLPINLTTFAYRLHLPDETQYDIYMGLDYLADLVSEKGPWNLGNVRRAENLRSLSIYRHYLTPDELNERNAAKREKYGYMNLCTGTSCPETGIWEGWTKDGPTDVLRVEKGRKFDVVRTVSIGQSTAPCPMIDGQWMWLCSLEEQSGFVWGGMKLKGLENEC